MAAVSVQHIEAEQMVLEYLLFDSELIVVFMMLINHLTYRKIYGFLMRKSGGIKNQKIITCFLLTSVRRE